MKTIKDDNLSFITRTYIYRGAPLLLVAALAGFSLTRPGTILTEDELWEAVEASLGKNDYIDQGFPRPTGVVILRARCYTPNGKPVPACPVSFQIGNLKKSLYVFGDRRWNTQAGVYTGITDPIPFTAMDISWENAFGGPSSALNPRGKGMAKLTDAAGKTYLPLPNVEDPADLVCAPGKLYRPRGFDYAGPEAIGQDDGDRKLNGTFDEDWLIHHWPYLPKDFDLRAAYAAPKDQRLEEGYFHGNESIVLENMHPTQRYIRTALPGVRMRMFARSVKFDLPAFEEQTAHLDKIWLFPHLETGIAIWHAMIAVGNEDADNLTHLLAFTEHLDEKPQSIAVYEAMIADAAGEETASAPVTPAIPEMAAPPFGQPSGGEKDSGAALAATLAAAGTTVIASAAKAGESMEAASFAHTEALLKEWEGKLAAHEAELDRLLKEAGINMPPPAPPPGPDTLSGLGPEAMLQKPEDLLAEIEEKLQRTFSQAGIDLDNLPPRPEAPPIKSLQEIVADMKQAGLENTELFAMVLGMGSALAALEKDQADIISSMKASVPGEGGKEEIPTEMEQPHEPPKTSLGREDVLARYAAGENLSGLDLTGIDLSACRLAGGRFKEAILEKADLRGADLTGADLTDAVLVGADCSGARLKGAILSGVAAGGMQAKKADLTGTQLAGADLAGANLEETSFKNVCLDEANFEGAVLKGCHSEDAYGVAVNFSGADLTGAQMHRCRLSRADFSDARLDNAAFGQADLTGASFHGSMGEGTQFIETKLTGARSNGEASFRNCDFHQAELTAASFQDSTFAECLFIRARMDDALFMNCQLVGSNFYRASARNARFNYSNLTGASLVAANLFQGSLRNAVLTRCDLGGTNLFAVSFYKAVFRETDLQNANLKRTFFEHCTPLHL